MYVSPCMFNVCLKQFMGVKIIWHTSQDAITNPSGWESCRGCKVSCMYQFNGLNWSLLVKHLEFEDIHNSWLYLHMLVKMKKASNHIWFNKLCKKTKIVPKYMKTTCRHKSPEEAQRASKKFYSYWLNLVMKKWYRRRNNLGVHVKMIHTELLQRLHDWEFDIFDQKIKIKVQEIAHKQHINQRHKLNRLC